MNDLTASLRGLGRIYERLVAEARGRRIYLVGGSVRDALMGRPATDFDFAVSGSGLEFARAFAARVRGALVILSEPDDEARVVCRDLTFDFNGFADRTIESDIMRRDFTINALAVELTGGTPGELLDMVDGRRAIERRLIRPVSDTALASAPLRLLRGLRIALELGFRIDESVFEQGHAISLAATAAERIGAEFLRIIESPDSYPLIRRLFDIGRLSEILPEFGPVFADPQLREHSFKTYYKIEEIIGQPGFFGRIEPEWASYFDRWGIEEPRDVPEPATDGRESEIVASPLPYRRGLLKLAGLLHDIAKPQTRFTNTDGEVHFYGHDSLGARVVSRLGRDRLRLSRAQTEMLSTLTAEHMRLHLLATADDLSDRAIRRYWRDLGPEAFGLMILCVADGWATAGRIGHLEDTITRMVAQKRAEDAKSRIARYVTGDDLIALGMQPGPAFKVILQELEDLQIEGHINSKEDGLEYLKTHLTTGGTFPPPAKGNA